MLDEDVRWHVTRMRYCRRYVSKSVCCFQCQGCMERIVKGVDCVVRSPWMARSLFKEVQGNRSCSDIEALAQVTCRTHRA